MVFMTILWIDFLLKVKWHLADHELAEWGNVILGKVYLIAG